jgi:clostripain
MINRKITLITALAVLSMSLWSYSTVKAEGTSASNITEQVENLNDSFTKDKNNSGKKLTVMVYSDADNNLEGDLLGDIQQMKDGYVDNSNLNLIVMVDRSPDFSDDSAVLGENFSDTRLFKIQNHNAVRIGGGKQFPEITTNSNYEANMGDAHTLKKFIDSCKANYTADKYVLIMANHGGGARDGKMPEKPKDPRAVCWDDTDDGDCLYTGEVSDVLTKQESVDVLAYDACLMGTSEVAYQYRPGNGGFQANVMVASAPVVWGDGYDYQRIFSRIKAGGGDNGQEDLTLGGKQKYFDPSTVTDLQLGAVMVEAQRNSVEAANVKDQVLSTYDLSKAQGVKSAVDNLSVALSNENKKNDIEKLRGSGRSTSLIHYFNTADKSEWINYPYFDLYDLCTKISTGQAFSSNIKDLAKKVMTVVDDMVVYSYGGDSFNGFTQGKSGLSIFLPDGNKIRKDQYSGTSFSDWQAQRWYNSIDTTTLEANYLYGKLSWCKDGQDPKINKVGNWFELLDSWFDKTNDKNGGYNGYQW